MIVIGNYRDSATETALRKSRVRAPRNDTRRDIQDFIRLTQRCLFPSNRPSIRSSDSSRPVDLSSSRSDSARLNLPACPSTASGSLTFFFS